MNKKLLLKFFLIFMLLSAQLTKGQNYTPLVVTSGFNEDVIAEDRPASTHTTAAVDATSSGANNAFMSINYPSATVGLPANGLITTIATATPGLTFQLAAYNQNNSLKINANNGTGTLAVQTTSNLSKLYILATSGSSPSTFTGTITFTDATTQTFASQSVPDWYDQGTPAIAIRGIGRVPRTGTENPDNNTTNPKLFQVVIAIDLANQNKVIQKVDFTKTSSTSGFLNIFALSGEITPTCLPPNGLGIQNLTATSVDLIWTSGGVNNFDIKWGTRGFNVASAGTLVTGFTNGGTLSNLTADTNYDYYVRRDCGATDGVSAWAGPFQFRTGYCIPTGSSNNSDEIRNFTLGSLNNSSTASDGVNGYKDYSGTVAPAQLQAGVAYIASLTSGPGSGTHGAAIWIDYNNNLAFDANEKIAVIGNTIGASATVNFPSYTIPETMAPGIYRLRVQYHHNKTGADLDPCAASSQYSEIEDYAVQILPPPPCALPSLLTATNLTFQSADLAWNSLGTTFDIKWGPRGFAVETAGTLVTGFANGSTLSNLTADTNYDYYVRRDCGTDGVTAWVGPYPFRTGYCIPTGSSNNADEIRNFTLSNLSNSSDPSEGVAGYKDYSATVAPAQLEVGGSYMAFLTSGTGSGNHGAAIWIDYNNDLVFDANEKVAVIGNTITANATVNFPEFTVPTTVQPAIYRLRVQYQHNKAGADLDSCTASSANAEIEDYAVQILPAGTCARPSALGVSNETATSANLHWTSSGTTFDIKWGPRGFDVLTAGTLVTGFANQGTLSGLTPGTYYAYYVRQNCGGTNGVSSWVGPFIFNTTLYCIPTGSSNNSDEIRNFTLGNLNNSSTASDGVAGYKDYSAIVAPAQLQAGASHVASLTSGPGTGNHGAAIWIDYNQNGIFDANEKVAVIGNTITPNATVSFPSFIIPETVVPGLYRLRVQYHTGKNGEDLNPCTATSIYSETEDYAVQILPPPACPLPSELQADNMTFVSADLSWTSSGTSFDIKWGARGFAVETAGTLVSGFANGGTLTGLTGDTNYDYYVRRNCGTDGVTAWVGPYAFRTGYCIPAGSANNADEIRNFTLSNLYNNSEPNEGVAGYKDYSATVAPAQLEAGGSYTASLTSGTGSGNHGAAIWIDYNNNLVFDANEKVAVIGNTITANATVNFPEFTVPATVQPGIYRLRVQYQHNKAGADLDPCTAASVNAEIEDYAVQILPAGTCERPSALGVSNETATSADLHWTSSGTAFDIKWGPRGFDVLTAGTLVTGFANQGTLSGLAIDTPYDYFVRQDCGGTNGVSSWVGPFRFNTLAYCVPTGSSNNSDEIRNFKLGNLNNNSAASEGTSGYMNYANTVAPAQLQAGSSYIASLTSGSGSGTHGAAIWIDFNQNVVFDANEKVAVIANTISASSTVNFPEFTVPVTTTPGIYRLRVQYHHAKNGADLNPCSTTSSYSETEDYAVEILPPPSCYFPSNFEVTQIGKTTARLTWGLPLVGHTTNVQYKVELRTSGLPGEATGLVNTFTTTDLFLLLTGLNTETEYTVYVQTVCSPTEHSDWSSPKVFKTLCNYPDYEFVTNEEDLTFCGSRDVTLEVATEGIVNWYNSSSATTPIHVGNSYTTNVTASTSLWYEVTSIGTSDISTGPLNAAAVGTSQDAWTTSTWDVNFTILEATTLKTIDIYPYTNGATGSMVFKQTGTTGSATVGTINYTTVGTGGTVKQEVPINLQLAPGTYKISNSLPSGGIRRNTSRASYPYTSRVASITGNSYDSAYYMGYYNWVFATGCKSAREEVLVTVIPNQVITNATVHVDATEGATLNIVSDASAFTIEYGLTGFERGQGHTVTDVENPYVFSSLRAHTTYDVYIQAQPCGTWYGPVTFITLEATDRQVITADDLVKTYGDTAFTHGESDSGLPLSYTIENPQVAAFENGQFVIKAAGTTRITAKQEGDFQYLPAENVTFTLTVNKAMLTVTADHDQHKEYGDEDPTLTYTVEGFKYDDDASIVVNGISRESGEGLGIYPIERANLYAGPNYNITFIGATFEITTATLYVSANALTKVYGDADPILTYTLRGVKFNDTPVVGGQLARVTGENVGVYTVNQGSLHLLNANYTLVYEQNDFSITPAILTIQPTVEMSKIYGAIDPVFTFTATGFKFNDTTETTVRGTISRTIGENVGLYSYEQGSLNTVSGNYTFLVLNDSKFEIKPASITVRVNQNQSKTFGQTDPLLTYTVEGLQRGEQPLQVMSGRLTRQPGEAIGLYRIQLGTLTSRTNYVIDTFVSADFEIVSGTITGLSLPSRTFIYDGTVKSLTVQGNVPADAVITYTNNEKIAVGQYQVTAHVDFGVNYEPINLQGILTIEKGDQIIDFEAPAQVMLEELPTLQLTATASSSLAVSYSIDFVEDREVATVSEFGFVNFLRTGFVTITARQAGNENYNAAVPVSRTIEVVSKNVDILDLIVDGVSYGRVEKEVYVVIGCESKQNSVAIEVKTMEGTIVSPGKHFVLALPEYGRYEQIIKVESVYGTTETYKVIVDKRIPADKIVYQKYNNVLLANNNKQTNGGYIFTSYEWFKNGEAIATGQAYSAGNNVGDALEVGATYHVELTLHDGKKITSCPIYIKEPTKNELSVYPNPVKKNQILNVRLDQDQQQSTTYVIYDVKGQLIQSGEFHGESAGINLPTTVASGSYFLVLKTLNGEQSVQFIVKE